MWRENIQDCIESITSFWRKSSPKSNRPYFPGGCSFVVRCSRASVVELALWESIPPCSSGLFSEDASNLSDRIFNLNFPLGLIDNSDSSG